MRFHDNKTHLLTKLKNLVKLGARHKLGEALLEAKMPANITFEEFFDMMKDKSEWMPAL